MRIAVKLTLAPLIQVLFIWGVGYYALLVSRRALQHTIEIGSMELAAKVTDDIDRAMYRWATDWRIFAACPDVQLALLESNRRFGAMADPQAFIDREDQQWVRAPKDSITPFMKALNDTEPSEDLRAQCAAWDRYGGYKVFGEAFITNRYGANVAQTSKTSDYRQDDEPWWQSAWKDGLFIGDIAYDESTASYSAVLCVRVDDPNGTPLGVLKATLDVDSIIAVMRDRAATLDVAGDEAGSVHDVILVDADRTIIFSTRNPNLRLQDGVAYGHPLTPPASGHTTAFQQDDGASGPMLVACAFSRGCEDYKGLGWALLIERNAAAALAPVTALEHNIIAASVIVSIAGLAFCLAFSVALARRVSRLRTAARNLGKGQLGVRVEDSSSDEIGQLARCFNDMGAALEHSTTELQEQAAHLDELVQERTADLEEESADHQRTAASLRKSQMFLEAVINSIPDALMVIDLQYRVVLSNRAARRHLYGDDASYEGLTCHIVSHHRDTPCDDVNEPCPLRTVLETKTPVRCEHIHHDADGSMSFVEVSAAPVVGDSGEVLQVIEICHDITQRKREEAELIEARWNAEAASRAKSTFLANMSHEIRTPLTAILGYAELLCESLSDNETRRSAVIIKRNGEHLLSVINAVLDISRIEAGKLRLEELPWSPKDIVAEVVSLLRVLAENKGVDLSEECSDDVPTTIVTDPIRLRQILLNVIGNAIKFTMQGSVRVVTRMTDQSDGTPKVRFDVIDTGIGMTGEDIGRLFQPFSQADASASRLFEGTGLGLAISKRLAEMLGGDIAVASQPGVGSTFTISIAARPSDQADVSPCASSTTASNHAGDSPTAGLPGSSMPPLLLAGDGSNIMGGCDGDAKASPTGHERRVWPQLSSPAKGKGLGGDGRLPSIR